MPQRIVVLKTRKKCRKLPENKNQNAPKHYIYAYSICRTWYCSYTMMGKPMKTLALHYPMNALDC